jgi:hypothetical protein
MFLLFDEAMVTRSSGCIMFFRLDLEAGEEPGKGQWKLYHTLEDIRGQIYYIRGNVRIQVVTDEKVYFYLIDKKTFAPSLENVMYNFMQCSQLMFGARVRYGISYKAGQPDFVVYTRKYFHNFKVAICSNNHEGARGANLSSTSQYVMAERARIGIYDAASFKVVQAFDVPTGGNKKLQILFLTVSKDDRKIGVCLGEHIIKDDFEVSEILVYLRDGRGLYELEKARAFSFNNETCPEFHFSHSNSNELLFFTANELFKFNYAKDGSGAETVYKFNNPLAEEPNFGVFSSD